jgi:hypothetical protein
MQRLVWPVLFTVVSAALIAVVAFLVISTPWEGTESRWSARECFNAERRADLFEERCNPQESGTQPDEKACELWNNLEREIADNCD